MLIARIPEVIDIVFKKNVSALADMFFATFSPQEFETRHVSIGMRIGDVEPGAPRQHTREVSPVCVAHDKVFTTNITPRRCDGCNHAQRLVTSD